MPVRKAKGYILEVTFIDGTRGIRKYDGFTEEQLRKRLQALGGTKRELIREVHSMTYAEWDQEYMEVRI